MIIKIYINKEGLNFIFLSYKKDKFIKFADTKPFLIIQFRLFLKKLSTNQ